MNLILLLVGDILVGDLYDIQSPLSSGSRRRIFEVGTVAHDGASTSEDKRVRSVRRH